jgi:phage repressor protein C with HTH and peptisase S24 domain
MPRKAQPPDPSTQSGRLQIARERAGFADRVTAAAALGVPLPRYNSHESGSRGKKGMPIEAAQQYARRFKVPVDWLLTGNGELDEPDAASSAELPESNVRLAPDAIPFDQIEPLARDVNVYGTLVGGDDGDFMFNGDVVDRVQRPRGLANVKNAYALRLVGSSMEPKYEEGDLIYVNPDRSPSIRDFVVIEMHPIEDGTPGKAYLKRLKARTPTKFVVEQYNPPKDIEFLRSAVKVLHRVVPLEELLGGA